ncbi:MAG: hypothetical protein WC979_00945 [Candidatus Pacearchaeota archaeon]|jgi:hypothetical protein|nr:hypothetical protein [Clostridia bacterium]
MGSSTIWSTERVNDVISKLENGLDVDKSCFYQGDINFRNGNINFKYTPQEQEEIVRCASDVLYFAEKYCHAMTDTGVQKIDLRPYQKDMLRDFQDHRYVIMLASRQIGKCHLFNSKLTIYDKKLQGYSIITVGQLYYMQLKSQRQLTRIEKLKYFLWQLYNKLD